ncbi:uncharacterized protein LOC127770899 [Oryza glaberrima]|uniref:uncharacterized protein LOC127770899 n=1 Tax=Oryza glaberrima TaxID=4538 RepID=UPI00224BEE58|nr:uncharacterized protein LOC127770899 [Oryza glaberrima]
MSSSTSRHFGPLHRHDRCACRPAAAPHAVLAASCRRSTTPRRCTAVPSAIRRHHHRQAGEGKEQEPEKEYEIKRGKAGRQSVLVAVRPRLAPQEPRRLPRRPTQGRPSPATAPSAAHRHRRLHRRPAAPRDARLPPPHGRATPFRTRSAPAPSSRVTSRPPAADQRF